MSSHSSGERPPSPWNLARIVAGLRARRASSPYSPEPRGPVERLPSWLELGSILDALRMALFPTHFGEPDLTEEGIDYLVGHELDAALGALLEQVRRELKGEARRQGHYGDTREERAIEIVRAFGDRLPSVRVLLETDIAATYRSDPAAKTLDEVLFCYPGVMAIIHHRIAHVLHSLGAPLLARMISEMAHSRTGVDIHPAAKIGQSFFIDHGTGVVIGETCVIGERVRIYQGVTLGAQPATVDEAGASVRGLPRHPVVEDDVVISAGATILGRITIGRGSNIGANAVLTESVPPGSVVTASR